MLVAVAFTDYCWSCS